MATSNFFYRVTPTTTTSSVTHIIANNNGPATASLALHRTFKATPADGKKRRLKLLNAKRYARHRTTDRVRRQQKDPSPGKDLNLALATRIQKTETTHAQGSTLIQANDNNNNNKTILPDRRRDPSSPTIEARRPKRKRTPTPPASPRKCRPGQATYTSDIGVNSQVPTLSQLCIESVAHTIDRYHHLERVLPQELLQRILNHLLAIGRLCDAHLPRLLTPATRSLQIAKCAGLSEVGCTYIADVCTNLQELDLHANEHLSVGAFRTILSRCSRLVSVDLNGCVIAPTEQWGLLGPVCSNLVTLNLAGTSIDDAGLKHILTSSSRLFRLNLRGCKNITDAGLTHVSAGLHSIDIFDCTQLTSSAIAIVASRCPKLYEIRLPSSVSDSSLIALSHSASNLRIIQMPSSPLVTDKGVRSILDGCLQLKTLNILQCRQITDDAFLGDIPLHNLSAIDLSRCTNITNRTLKSLASRCPNLKSLRPSLPIYLLSPS
eukprot:TRINITY_DN5030_c0_g3_i2.p1 TRINITY_DN5030_c0_g3~~TRINITY_DN5030_c0_g3_i2.p1  ORF type:complete len:491 (+),score=33.38 TRINITY_DN5030_c0_g3_i2:136-1608(+)